MSPMGGWSGQLGEFALLPLQKFEIWFPLGTEQFLETFQHCATPYTHTQGSNLEVRLVFKETGSASMFAGTSPERFHCN